MGYFKENTSKPTVKILEICAPEVLINPNALVKMQLYVDGCTDEIGWLGTARRNDNIYIIDDVFLFEQEVHGATTEINPEGLSKFAEELLQKPEGMDIWNNMKVWGHSHVNMSTSPSGQDDKQMETFSQNGHDWFIRIIANKNGSLRIDLYDYKLGLIYNELPWEEACSPDELTIIQQINQLESTLDGLRKQRTVQFKDPIKKEIDNKVKKKVYGNIQPAKTTTYTGTVTDKKKYGAQQQFAVHGEKDFFKTDEEVWNYLDNTTLLEIGDAETIKQVEYVFLVQGYGKLFSNNDLIRAWKIGKQYASYVYSGTKLGRD